MAATPTDANHPAMRSEGSGSIERDIKVLATDIRVALAPLTGELFRLAAREVSSGFLQQFFLKADEKGDGIITRMDAMIAAKITSFISRAAIAQATLPAAHGNQDVQAEKAKPINPDPPEDFGAFITKTI